MSIVQQTFKTISCNGPSCTKTVTYDAQQQDAEQQMAQDTPWIKNLRLVHNAQGRNFCYCSDECEIASIAEGNHNPEVRKTIVLPTGANAPQLAAAQAAAAEKATKALKDGAGVTLETR
jgi:hypothetical protein